VIREDPHRHARGVVLAQMFGELYFLMNGIVAAHESANEAHHDE
jgi:hypothetical protein